MSPFDDARIRVFRAPTTHEALRRVRAALGGDAVVLRTRQVVEVDPPGSRPRRLVEVTASAEPLTDAPVPRRTAPKPTAPSNATATTADVTPETVSQSVEAASQDTTDPSPLADRLDLIERALAELLTQSVAPQAEAAVARPTSSEAVPPTVPFAAVPNEPPSETTAEPPVAERPKPVARTVPIAWPQPGERATLALVGASDALRTRVVAQLAATFAMLRGRRVGVVQVQVRVQVRVQEVSEAARPSLPEPLRLVREAAGVPVFNATDAASLRAAMHRTLDCELLLIDAATSELLKTADDIDQTLAVVDTTEHRADLASVDGVVLTAAAFDRTLSDLPIAAISRGDSLLTGLDEATPEELQFAPPPVLAAA